MTYIADIVSTVREIGGDLIYVAPFYDSSSRLRCLGFELSEGVSTGDFLATMLESLHEVSSSDERTNLLRGIQDLLVNMKEANKTEFRGKVVYFPNIPWLESYDDSSQETFTTLENHPWNDEDHDGTFGINGNDDFIF